jgi:Asp/Glu/hydantoin racemase
MNLMRFSSGCIQIALAVQVGSQPYITFRHPSRYMPTRHPAARRWVCLPHSITGHDSGHPDTRIGVRTAAAHLTSGAESQTIGARKEESTMPRIALIHATPLSVAPICETFAALWPQAQVTNLLEDSLSTDLAAAGKLDGAMIERFVLLARYCVDCGADAVLFSCSAFGPAIEAARAAVTVPVLKPNEAMLDEALDAGKRIGLIATFEPSIPALRAELEETAAERGIAIEVETRVQPAAMPALQAGDAETHDRLIVQAARELKHCDVIVLGQFSMARAAALVESATGCKVLTSPRSAVVRLRRVLAD